MRHIGFVLPFLLPACLTAGEISGRVVLTRPLTKPRVGVAAYQPRGAFVTAAEDSRDPSAEELNRVAIYLQGDGLAAGEPLTAELRQQRRQFSPELLVVPAGSTVAFPNGDPIFHNVFSLSKARQFDLGYYPKNESRSVKFDKPGVVQVYCRIHRAMTSAIVVVPSAWYGRPGSDGRFSLKQVPAGTYQLVVWHKSSGLLHTRVDVPPTGAVEVVVDLPIIAVEPAH